MDSSRFDALTKRLAAGGLSRRRLLRAVGGAVAGGALAAAGHEQADAFVCRQPGVLCGKDAHCCSNHCDLTNPDPHLRYRCAAECPAGQFLCADQSCADCCPNSACPINQACCDGTCGYPLSATCTDDTQCCSGICHSLYLSCVECGSLFNGYCGRDEECCSGQHCSAETGFCE